MSHGQTYSDHRLNQMVFLQGHYAGSVCDTMLVRGESHRQVVTPHVGCLGAVMDDALIDNMEGPLNISGRKSDCGEMASGCQSV